MFYSFFYRFFEGRFERLPGAIRNGFWDEFDAKSLPKWSQVGRKTDWTWSIDFKTIFRRMLYRFSLLVQQNIKWPRARMYCKLQYKIDIFGCRLLCCWVVPSIDFRLFFDGCRGRKSIKNPLKICLKTDQKTRCDWGWSLEGSWNDFWSILEANLTPSWDQVGSKIAFWSVGNRIQKKHQKRVTRVAATSRN